MGLPEVKNFANNCHFLGYRATEEGGGALGEKEPLEEHPGCVWSILAGLVLTVLESAASQQVGFVFALGLIGTEFQCERLARATGACSNFVLDSVYSNLIIFLLLGIVVEGR
jgi:hypothetical protein